jgi:hypothetical protein
MVEAEMWRRGLRKYGGEEMIPKRKGDFGMGFDLLKEDAERSAQEGRCKRPPRPFIQSLAN